MDLPTSAAKPIAALPAARSASVAGPLAAAVAASWLCLAGPALAQTTVTRSETVPAGKQARLVIVPNLKKDCSSGPMPEIKVVTPPKSGSLITKAGKLKTPAKYRCPNKDAEVQAIFYQPTAAIPVRMASWSRSRIPTERSRSATSASPSTRPAIRPRTRRRTAPISDPEDRHGAAYIASQQSRALPASGRKLRSLIRSRLSAR